MMQHLPILQVLLPLVTAPVVLLFARPRLAWWLNVLASSASLVVAILLLARVLQTGPIDYALGNWPAPWGIVYHVDTLSALVLVVVSAMGAIVGFASLRSVEHEIGNDRAHLFHTAYLLCLAGLLGITITGDAFNLFVFLEISSLSTYALVSMGRQREALVASFQYLVLGTIGATFILIAVGLLYFQTGTLNMADLSIRLASVRNSHTTHAALAFLTIGVGLKLALFPLHLWMPGAYTWAPSVVSAFLASTATKVALYVLLRFLFTIFGVGFSFQSMPVGTLLVALGLLAIVSGSLVAIYQDNTKRMLAWSSVAQIGYMAIGIGLVSVTGLTASLLHLFNHALMKAALFLCLAAVVYRVGSVRLQDLAGIGRQMPWTMAAFTIGGLSLIGIPGTVGFVSKWYLVQAAVQQHQWLVVGLILVSSLLAVIYVWRVVEVVWLRSAESGATVSEAPLSLLLPLWLLAGANLWFGIDTRLSTGAASQAARLLMGGS